MIDFTCSVADGATRTYNDGTGGKWDHTKVKVQQQTPDDDGQYGASLESSARDETRPTKYPTHLRGSGRVSEETKRSTAGKRLANEAKPGQQSDTDHTTIDHHPPKQEETERDCKQ